MIKESENKWKGSRTFTTITIPPGVPINFDVGWNSQQIWSIHQFRSFIFCSDSTHTVQHLFRICDNCHNHSDRTTIRRDSFPIRISPHSLRSIQSGRQQPAIPTSPFNSILFCFVCYYYGLSLSLLPARYVAARMYLPDIGIRRRRHIHGDG